MNKREIKNKMKEVKDIEGLFKLLEDEDIQKEKFGDVYNSFLSFIADCFIENKSLFNEMMSTFEMMRRVEDVNEKHGIE